MKWLAVLLVCLSGCHEWSALSTTYQTDASSDGMTDALLALFMDDFQGFTNGQAWSAGVTHGSWNCISTGFGSVDIKTDGSQVMSLSTSPVTGASDTHTARIRTDTMFGDFDATVRMRTAFQVRSPSPNPFEIASLQWHYSDESHFYFLLLMPTGWQLGKVTTDPTSGLQSQKLLEQSATPTFPVGTWYGVRIVQTSGTISISIDGSPLITHLDLDSPYVTGYIAFSARDAEAHFDDIVVLRP